MGMELIGIEEAKAEPGKMIEEAAKGKAFLVIDGGQPLFKVIPYEDPPIPPGSALLAPQDPAYRPVPPGGKRKIGFLEGQLHIGDDIKKIGSEEILKMFGIEK